MRKVVQRLAVVVALTLAFAPFAWERLLVPPVEAQFAGFAQALTLQNAVTTTANGANLDTSGNPIVALQVSGITGSGQVNPEGSLDGTTWNALTCYPIGSSSGTSLLIASITHALVRCNTVGIPVLRARIAVTGGTITVKGYATQSYFPLGTNTP